MAESNLIFGPKTAFLKTRTMRCYLDIVLVNKGMDEKVIDAWNCDDR